MRRVRPLKVLKFGGTSVGAPERLRRVVEIVTRAAVDHRVVVIASAASGVTDRLILALERLPGDAGEVDVLIRELTARHVDLAAGVLAPATRAAYEARLDNLLIALRARLEQARDHGLTPALRDDVVAAGERLSVPLVAAAVRDAGPISFDQDAAPLVHTDATHGEAIVDLGATEQAIQHWWRSVASDTVPVVTGFIGSTPEGATTTLGRGGSDYSAALFAASLRADAFERWTDVDGLYTDDPRRNEQAQRLAFVILEEAVHWNHAGRLGMHRKALDPLVAAGIPAYVRSTALPDEPGTVILPAGHHLARIAAG